MTEIFTLAQAGAVISACWAIITGIGAWKREFIGKRQIELAEQVLAKFFEIKDAIAMIRSPFSRADEGSSRKRSEHESRESRTYLIAAISSLSATQPKSQHLPTSTLSSTASWLPSGLDPGAASSAFPAFALKRRSC